MPVTPSPGSFRNSVTGGSSLNSARAAVAHRPTDGMLGGRLDRAREPEDVRPGHAVERHDVDERHPALGHGPRLVENHGAELARLLEDLRALDEDAELRAAPVPTISAVGVARPSAHGHAMMSTATAAVNAAPADEPESNHPASVAAEIPITIGTKTAETRSASRWTGAFPDWACSTRRAICASAVSAPTFVARTTADRRC